MDASMMDVYPVHNMNFEENGNLITVLFINPKPNLFERILLKKRLKIPKKIDFDEIGSFIWKKCDGKTRISEIIESLQNEFGEKVEDAEERVILFMKQLSRGRLINLFKKEKE